MEDTDSWERKKEREKRHQDPMGQCENHGCYGWQAIRE